MHRRSSLTLETEAGPGGAPFLAAAILLSCCLRVFILSEEGGRQQTLLLRVAVELLSLAERC